MFYLELFRDKGSVSNYVGWEDANYRSLLTKAEHTIDQRQRSQLLQQAEKQLFDEMPAIPIFTQRLQYLVRDNIDLAILDLGIYDFKSTRVR
jgi:oligopeptide transport system substrate-binding protein